MNMRDQIKRFGAALRMGWSLLNPAVFLPAAVSENLARGFEPARKRELAVRVLFRHSPNPRRVHRTCPAGRKAPACERSVICGCAMKRYAKK